jgi:hypothetical protein
MPSRHTGAQSTWGSFVSTPTPAPTGNAKFASQRQVCRRSKAGHNARRCPNGAARQGYIHTYTHTYIHSHIHTLIHTRVSPPGSCYFLKFRATGFWNSAGVVSPHSGPPCSLSPPQPSPGGQSRSTSSRRPVSARPALSRFRLAHHCLLTLLIDVNKSKVVNHSDLQFCSVSLFSRSLCLSLCLFSLFSLSLSILREPRGGVDRQGLELTDLQSLADCQ